jgi:hypothetical protein
MKRYVLASSVLLAAVAIGACGGGDAPEQRAATANADEGVALDVNDVSLLFPLPQNEGQLGGLLSINAPGAGGPLLGDENFRAVLALAEKPGDSPFPHSDPAKWKVVGARVDDCAKLRADDAGCIPQLRLIAQPVEAAVSSRGLDQAIHLVYNLAPASFDGLVDGLVALKKAASVRTNGVPLHVHPTMRAEGLDGPFATGLKRLIAENVGPQNLFATAVMLTRQSSFAPQAVEWRFASGVVRDGAVVRAPLGCAPPDAKTIDVIGGAQGGLFNRVLPAATCADNVDDIVQSHRNAQAPFFQKPAAEQQERVDAALRIENPLETALADTHCAGCHVGSRALVRAKGVNFLASDVDQNPNRFAPAPGITTTFRSGRADPNAANPDDLNDISGPYEVRAFGYLNGLPSYTMRTVNESAHVVEALNKKLGIVARVGFCEVRFPASVCAEPGGSAQVFGRVFVAGRTDGARAGAGIRGEIGVGPAGTDPRDPAAGWTFTPAQPNAGFNFAGENNDEYVGTVTAPAAGPVAYAYRFSVDGGDFLFCDTDGVTSDPNDLPFDVASLGVLNVGACPLPHKTEGRAAPARAAPPPACRPGAFILRLRPCLRPPAHGAAWSRRWRRGSGVRSRPAPRRARRPRRR